MRNDQMPVKSNEVMQTDSYSQLTSALPITASVCVCVSSTVTTGEESASVFDIVL